MVEAELHRVQPLALEPDPRGEKLTDEQVKKMQAYFKRHAVDKDAKGFTGGTDGFPSPGRVAWGAWGGDAGERWVNGIDL